MTENPGSNGGELGMKRVFGSLQIKMVDQDQRIIEGIATTPKVDRVGDIVEPLGVEYELPLPLLLDHDHTLAVGEVEMAEVTKTGIRFRARIKKIAEPGLARDLVDKAWHLLKNGLRRAVSIGFAPSEREAIGGGWRFTRWTWLELSAVSVPANADARITGLKRAPKPKTGPKFISAADRRARRGGFIVDERKYVRNARRALALRFGETVPNFQTLKALEAWDDDRQRSAISRGATYLGYEAIVDTARPAAKLPVVRLGR